VVLAMAANGSTIYIYRGGSRNLRRGVLLKECARGARGKFRMTTPTVAKPHPF